MRAADARDSTRSVPARSTGSTRAATHQLLEGILSLPLPLLLAHLGDQSHQSLSQILAAFGRLFAGATLFAAATAAAALGALLNHIHDLGKNITGSTSATRIATLAGLLPTIGTGLRTLGLLLLSLLLPLGLLRAAVVSILTGLTGSPVAGRTSRRSSATY
ncbi:MAG: hypothetical protein KC910_00475 [Candidatus Eremiobacteraeota bacterium]|nr:hypothetical protein [Candidatus Eremiobacteraeota bacterium]